VESWAAHEIPAARTTGIPLTGQRPAVRAGQVRSPFGLQPDVTIIERL
jgi:hypothetical protein